MTNTKLLQYIGLRVLILQVEVNIQLETKIQDMHYFS